MCETSSPSLLSSMPIQQQQHKTLPENDQNEQERLAQWNQAKHEAKILFDVSTCLYSTRSIVDYYDGNQYHSCWCAISTQPAHSNAITHAHTNTHTHTHTYTHTHTHTHTHAHTHTHMYTHTQTNTQAKLEQRSSSSCLAQRSSSKLGMDASIVLDEHREVPDFTTAVHDLEIQFILHSAKPSPTQLMVERQTSFQISATSPPSPAMNNETELFDVELSYQVHRC